ncbi:hypothetical protein EDD18DRAFT_1113413 [Armillaria luteobubalina]|uniref:Uncharacterized protein n=1 Tax=Armillaria luteobubalina TaxID=153913 RepID=A0AA39U9C7_9AGAR|nr:hypothetical protein EDD18DRAFT_1113413 [Armillaria luteobubalina]
MCKVPLTHVFEPLLISLLLPCWNYLLYLPGRCDSTGETVRVPSRERVTPLLAPVRQTLVNNKKGCQTNCPGGFYVQADITKTQAALAYRLHIVISRVKPQSIEAFVTRSTQRGIYSIPSLRPDQLWQMDEVRRRIAATEPIPEPAQCSESETFTTQNHYSECHSASPPITNEEVVMEPVIASERTSSPCGWCSPSPIQCVTVVPQQAQLSVGGKPFRPHAKWYLLHARDVETKFHAHMRGRTPCEYMEWLYQRFLRLYLKGVCGAMFEIDDEEETLQTLLDELCQCTEGILNVAGVGKNYCLVEDIIWDMALVHSWLFEIQTDVFAEGQEYIVYQHRKSALLYQQENFEN